MFKIFHGFHLVEAYHKNKRENRSQESSVNKRIITALILSVITLIIWNLPAGVFGIDGLTVIQQRIIAIFILATLMWITEVVPSWATSIFIMVFLLLFTSNSGIKPMVNEEQVGQLLSYKDIMSSFADPVIMLFIGGFILAIAASKTGLDTHLAHVLLKPFGTKSENVLLGFILITGFFSMFVSNTATAAMMLTFLAPVFKQLPPEGKGRIALTLAIPLAANLGGMGTPIGTPPNTIAMKFLNDPDGLNMGLGFGQWMLFMFPLVILLLFIGWFLLKTMYPFSQKTIHLEIESNMEKSKHTKIVIWTFIV
ncbi:MAG: anion permease, partial [Muribaculaceae bacterium]|nr:anion permease [Muribaculaceae bacterium]